MTGILRRIHLYAYFASVLFFFSLGYPLLFYYARNPKKHYRKLVSFRRWISLAGIYAVGIRVRVTYETPIDWSQNYVLCANHTSFLDITILNYLCKSPFSFMGKIELLKNPVTRIFFQTIDIPVKRDSKVSAFKAYKRALEFLQDGKSLAIFPEGRIDNVYPPVLHRFKSGAFRIACENRTPILPIVIQDAWQVLWDDGKTYGSKPGVIHVKVLAPIAPNAEGGEAFSSLEAEVYHKMDEAWNICNK
ncbi:lysophospholipid acyltransferase family protein [Sphingobacterium sp. SGR-19]|uniref:lysophospholipid acyltransferase family protein n=1 Tax=Sphingobacterium sp. SGR-19 TaxID=2710886 RepID=UPI0013E9B378|nr:lysophospholipid acyltransferase family protein [Sphingobacterium sp. SGR-19]NGM64748.1 1-acyl-sn-glycerol-3-phosphate acyltransferase [Sphingobacterium sp. SGR-19]